MSGAQGILRYYSPMRHPIKEAPDYTNAFLVMAFVNLFAWLVLIWAAFGYVTSLGVAYLLHVIIRRRAAQRS